MHTVHSGISITRYVGMTLHVRPVVELEARTELEQRIFQAGTGMSASNVR